MSKLDEITIDKYISKGMMGTIFSATDKEGNKYLKYKTKYLKLKNNDMIGGSSKNNKKILFIMFQGSGTNLKDWNEYTESKFLNKLKKLGKIYTYQDKLYNTMYYDKTNPNYKDYDSDIDFNLNYIKVDSHIRIVYKDIKSKYKDFDNYEFIPIAWSAGGYLALYFSQIYSSRCKMCILLDSVLITKQNINLRLKNFEYKIDRLVYPITNNKYIKLLNELKINKNDGSIITKIITTSNYIRTLFAKNNINTKFKIPVISFVYISKREKNDGWFGFNNETKLREIDLLSKLNPKMYKSYQLNNVGHCVFNKKKPANFIINKIKIYLNK